MRELVATFLFAIRRDGRDINIGAAVDDRAQIVILKPEALTTLTLSMHEATELQKKIREAVVAASLLTF